MTTPDRAIAGPAPSYLRIGGTDVLPSGELVVWSVADGRRGRRWRESTTLAGRLVRSLLFETDPAGRVTRLEIATAAGLLTLHPAGEPAAIHGNVVTAPGIRHLGFTAEAGTVLVVEGSAASDAIVLGGSAPDGLAVGESRHVAGVWVDDRLEPEPAAVELVRLEPRAWRWTTRWPDGRGSSGEPRVVRLDDDGLVDRSGRMRWPLEV